jgi:hypothetical protein
MSDEFSKVEVITGVARRRRFSTEQKLAIVAVPRPTVDWDTSQADDFRERGGSWTRTRT